MTALEISASFFEMKSIPPGAFPRGGGELVNLGSSREAGMKFRFLFSMLFLLGLLLLALPWHTAAQKKAVYVIEIQDAITPAAAHFIQRALNRASRDRAECLIIQLDTPGGLDTSMRDIIKDILNAEVPVVVYVAPSGARAASAGVFITLAADIAAMAPGTAPWSWLFLFR
jgi:membrane-bound serine protease (ClpP class)